MFKLILLDRDGVINEDSSDYIKSAAEWQPLPGSLEAISALYRAGSAIGVCTNQSGIGRGIFTEANLKQIHDRMNGALAELGVTLAGLEYCPHHPDEQCDCRKPKPAMLNRLRERLGVATGDCCFVGDSRKDLEAAIAAGVQPILVRTGNGLETERALTHFPLKAPQTAVQVFDDLASFARSVLADESA